MAIKSAITFIPPAAVAPCIRPIAQEIRYALVSILPVPPLLVGHWRIMPDAGVSRPPDTTTARGLAMANTIIRTALVILSITMLGKVAYCRCLASQESWPLLWTLRLTLIAVVPILMIM